MKKCISWCE